MSKTKYSLQELQDKLYSAVISDSLDSLGFKHQSPDLDFRPYTGIDKLVGRAKTTLWADMFKEDPNPYALELKAVDDCQDGDILVAAAGGSRRSGIWGELLSTAARNSGCVGAVIHGATRDIAQIRKMQFPVFATASRLYDSLHRQRVIDIDVPVEMGGVIIEPGSLLFCDQDGIVVIPLEVEEEAVSRAMTKVDAENTTRDAIKSGMKATAAYEKFGIL